MWGSGDSHGHRDRIIDSKVVSSEQLADLYLLYKDHKEGRKTRPVVTGCTSNTRGFSNCVSDLLESVNKADQTPYEAISSEDMLSKVEAYNEEAERIMKDGREALYKKIMCRKVGGVKKIICCDKLWNYKKTKAGKNEETEDEMEPNDGMHMEEEENASEDLRVRGGANDGMHMDNKEVKASEDLRLREECGVDKHEEVLKFREHQYDEKPAMRLTPEDIVMVMECDHCGPDNRDNIAQV